MKTKIILFPALTLLFASLAHADSLPVKRIAMLKDGPSFHFDEIKQHVKDELATLTDGEWKIEFVESKEFTADWNWERAGKALAMAVEDPSIDLIFAGGLFVSHAAVEHPGGLPKPVISGFVEAPDTIALPLTPEHTSTTKNYTFVVENSSAEDDVIAFRKIVPFSTLHAFVDETIMEAAPYVDEIVKKLENELNIQITLIPMGRSALESLSKLPRNAKAVYLTPPLLMSRGEYQKLIDGINEKRVPSFSMLGHEDVERGALAGQTAKNRTRIARRIALNIQQILLGTPPETMNVMLESEPRLMLNGRTAGKIGIAIPYDILLTAQTLHSEEMEFGNPLDLTTAMEKAIAGNYRLTQADADVDKAMQDKARARSAMLPQVTANMQYMQIDRDRARASMGLQPEKTTSGGIALSQMIFSDPAITAFRAESHSHLISQLERDSTRLDVLHETAQAYVNLLSAQAVIRIEDQNYALIRQYLDLAVIRQKSGQAGPEEVFRWETRLTAAHSSMLQAYSRMLQASAQLNQAMNQDLDNLWHPLDLGGENDINPFWGSDLAARVSDDTVFQALTEHLVELAESRAPELKALDLAIRANKIVLAHHQRRFVIPDIGVSAMADHYFDRTMATADSPMNPEFSPEDEEWAVAVTARWSLFEGGANRADIHKTRAEIRRLNALRNRTRQLIRQRLYNALFSASSTYANIDLSRKAAELARKNLDVIQEKYTRGVVSILELLDAQNEVFVREENEALAKYMFFQDIIEIERSIAWFPEISDPQKLAEWNEILNSTLLVR